MKNSRRLAIALVFSVVAGNACAGTMYAVREETKGLKSIGTPTLAATAIGATGAGGRTARVTGLGTSAALERVTRAATVDQPSTLALFAIAVAWMAANRRRRTVY